MKTFLYENLTDTTKNIFTIYETYNETEEEHVHDFIEIIYILSGEIEQCINGHTFHTKRGDLLFLDLGATHSFIPKNKISYYNICLKPATLEDDNNTTFSSFLKDVYKQNKSRIINKSISFEGNERRIIEDILENLIIEQTHGNNLLSDEVTSNFMSIIISKIISKTLTPDLDNNGWEDLDKFIDENLDSDLSLHNLSSRAFYNPSYFSRVFKQKHGESLVSYVNRKKIEKAKQMLITTDDSVEEISNKLGYSNVSVFYRNFTKITGTTPINFKTENK